MIFTTRLLTDLPRDKEHGYAEVRRAIYSRHVSSNEVMRRHSMGWIAGLIVAAIVLFSIGIAEKNAGIIAGIAGFLTKFIVDSLFRKK